MHEFAEFRIPEERAACFLGPEHGVVLGGTVRKLVVSTSDPLLEVVRDAFLTLKQSGEEFFTAWIPHRRYTRQEIESAELLRLQISTVFQPTGEQCGTVYDYSSACTICHVGRRQVSDLVLDLRRVPKKDIARTIGEEWIVSQRVAELIVSEKLSGVMLQPVRHAARYEDDSLDLHELPSGRTLIHRAEVLGIDPQGWEFTVWLNGAEQVELLRKAVAENVTRLTKRAARRPRSLPVWYQLVITSAPVETVAPTRFGMHIFDEDQQGTFRCSRCAWAGLNLLSEIRVPRNGWNGSDFLVTRELVGRRAGEVVPASLLLISARARSLLEQQGITGFKLEVVHLEPSMNLG